MFNRKATYRSGRPMALYLVTKPEMIPYYNLPLNSKFLFSNGSSNMLEKKKKKKHSKQLLNALMSI